MRHSLSTQIEINANPEKIWKTLTNFKEYPDWNPFITSIVGDVKEGAKLEAKIGSMNFKPKVLTVLENRELKWIGRLIMPGVFDGEHRFQIIKNENGGCTFIQSEKFNGILVGIFKKKLDTDTLEGFKAMNEALKERCEKEVIWKL